MNQKLKLSAILRRGFGIIGILIVVVGVVSYLSNRQSLKHQHQVVQLEEIIHPLDDIHIGMLSAEAGERGFIITGKEEFLEPYENGVRNMGGHFSTLKKLTMDDPTQLKAVDELEVLVKRAMDALARNVALKREKKDAEVIEQVSSGVNKRLFDACVKKLAEIEEKEREQLAQSTAAANRALVLENVAVNGGLALTLLASATIYWYIQRRFVQPVAEVANNVATASAEIAASVEQHEKTALHQAASVTETTTTTEELNASFRQSVEMMEAASEKARQVAATTEEGNRLVQQSVAGMGDLQKKVGSIAEQILRLSEQTSQIGNITALVSGLAGQTNMLALNAAVEAARAGEHGKGFAVVAAEIRKLADQSRKAAEQITVLVADIQKANNATVMVTEEGTKSGAAGMRMAEESSESFLRIRALAKELAEAAQQVMLNSRQQVNAVKQVAQAMDDVARGSKETAAGITQTKTGVDQLKVAAQTMRALV